MEDELPDLVPDTPTPVEAERTWSKRWWAVVVGLVMVFGTIGVAIATAKTPSVGSDTTNGSPGVTVVSRGEVFKRWYHPILYGVEGIRLDFGNVNMLSGLSDLARFHLAARTTSDHVREVSSQFVGSPSPDVTFGDHLKIWLAEAAVIGDSCANFPGPMPLPEKSPCHDALRNFSLNNMQLDDQMLVADDGA